jgi:hypothetical protein
MIESKHKQQKTDTLCELPPVAIVARIASIPSFTLILHDNGTGARQRVFWQGNGREGPLPELVQENGHFALGG